MRGYLSFKDSNEVLYVPGRLVVYADYSCLDNEIYYISFNPFFLTRFEFMVKNKEVRNGESSVWKIEEVDVMDEMMRCLTNMQFRGLSDEQISEEAIGLYEWVRSGAYQKRESQRKLDDDSLCDLFESIDDFLDPADLYRNQWWEYGGEWKPQWE